MIQAIQEWGSLKGIYLGMKRMCKCHPWGTHGYDPVPKKHIKKEKKKWKITKDLRSRVTIILEPL